jgi:hypothetical protein
MSQTGIAATERNKLGDVALGLAVSGWIAAFAPFYPPFAILGSIVCPLGLILGLIALRHEPKRSAFWAVGLGIVGQFFFVGTIWSRLLLLFQSRQ